MRRVLLFAIITTLILLTTPSYGREFTRGDFDPPDPDQVEDYRFAVIDLIEELTLIAVDDDGNTLFSVTPFPVELVALMTQLDIHQYNVTDPSELDELIARKNYIKPAPNTFAFVLDGDPGWVNSEVYMFYYPEDGSDPVQLYLHQVESDSPGDLPELTTWALLIQDLEELEAFLAAPDVILAIWNEEADPDPKILDCGYWRLWSLFDLRDLEE